MVGADMCAAGNYVFTFVASCWYWSV